jgi:hypothetical protein
MPAAGLYGRHRGPHHRPCFDPAAPSRLAAPDKPIRRRPAARGVIVVGGNKAKNSPFFLDDHP